MRFELFQIAQYLKPKWRQLSQSLIGIIAISVIGLVVWLILVFFSVTDGLERMWIGRLTVLTAPLRITPTDAYYNSYYYKVDQYSSASSYSHKTLREKLLAESIDSYNPETDEELPDDMPVALKNSEGTPKDLVKELVATIHSLPGLKDARVLPYEVSPVSFRLKVFRPESVTQDSMAWSSNYQEGTLSHAAFITSWDLKTLPEMLFPLEKKDWNYFLFTLSLKKDLSTFQKLTKQFDITSFETSSDENGSFTYPNLSTLPKTTPYELFEKMPTFFTKKGMESHQILLPKGYREAGFYVGDQGDLFYEVPTLTSTQTMREPIVISGFYDPGLLSMGGRFLLASEELVSSLISHLGADNIKGTSGFHVRFNDYKEAPLLKTRLEEALNAQGLLHFFQIETYEEYEYAKELIRELKSQKNLFSLISLLIIIVACSNIVSMLILLVNDKRKEIAILRTMGASSWQIGLIFGLTGLLLGVFGSLVGLIAASITMAFVPSILSLLSAWQGFDAFHILLQGSSLPNTLSVDAAFFVVGSTIVVSLIAGLIPALKACAVKPSELLKSA